MLFLLLFPILFCPLLAIYVLKFVPYEPADIKTRTNFYVDSIDFKEDEDDDEDDGGENEIPDFPLDLPPGISLLPKGAPDPNPSLVPA